MIAVSFLGAGLTRRVCDASRSCWRFQPVSSAILCDAALVSDKAATVARVGWAKAAKVSLHLAGHAVPPRLLQHAPWPPLLTLRVASLDAHQSDHGALEHQHRQPMAGVDREELERPSPEAVIRGDR